MNTREYRERLIDEVKKYPVLYDTHHENHRDIDVRDRCWNEISERLGANCEVLKREWKILRDSLRQSMKKSHRGATTKAGVPCKPWRFQKRMAFVLPHMMTRRRKSLKDDIKVDIETEAMSEPDDPEVWDLAPAPAASGAGEGAAAAGGDAEGAEGHEALELFFASVCQSCKRLPARLQGQVKRQVLDVLLRAEHQMDEHAEHQLGEHGEHKDTLYKSF